MQIKVCGVRDAAFARAAARLGVDYLGLIFAARSPRRVTAAEAKAVASALAGLGPARPRLVGVFVEQTAEEIRDIAAAAGLDVVQLHAASYTEADAAALRAAGREVWVLNGLFGDATLLDGAAGGRTGGTGTQADWSRVKALKDATRRVVLAGGLSAANVRAAAATGADVLDVNSSLETAPGVKSEARLRAFLAAAGRL